MLGEHSFSPKIGLVCAAASFVVLAAVTVVLEAITPGYDALSETVSHLASRGQPYAQYARAAFIAYGLLVITGAGALAAETLVRRRAGAALLAAFGACSIVAGLAPKDPPGPIHTLPSEIHVDATIVGGAALLAVMLLMFRGGPTRLDRILSLVAATLTTVVIGIFRFTWGNPYYGLIERALLLIGAGWLSLMAAHRRVSLRKSNP